MIDFREWECRAHGTNNFSQKSNMAPQELLSRMAWQAKHAGHQAKRFPSKERDGEERPKLLQVESEVEDENLHNEKTLDAPSHARSNFPIGQPIRAKMFQRTGAKNYHCRWCMLTDARRSFLNGEGYERVQFGEIDANSRAPSPGGYNNHSISRVCPRDIQQENNCPQRTQVLEEQTWMDGNDVCKKCSHHHKAYGKKMELPVEQRPTRFKASEDNAFGRGEDRKGGPWKTRRAPPKEEIWTPDAMRGLENLSPSQMGGRNAMSPSQRSTDKWKEEHLSLRFSDTPQTECAHCLHHHGIDLPQPDPDEQLLERLLSSFPSKEYLKAEESLRRRNGGEWWGTSQEERNCSRCSSHHINNEGLLNLNEEVKRMNKQLSTLRAQMGKRTTSGQQRMAPGRSRSSSPEFTTPPREFPRSRTPTPQRSHNYREMYERKIQARSKVNRSPNFELQQLWKQSGKMPKYDIAEFLRKCRVPKLQRNYENSRGVSPDARPPLESITRRQNSPGGFPQHHKSSSKKGPKSVEKVSKSPKWSKECLHKIELRRRINKQEADMVDAYQQERLRKGINHGRVLVGQSRRTATNWHGKPLTGRMLSPKSKIENSRGGMINRSRAIPVIPNRTTKEENNLRSRSQLENEMREKVLEEQESRWAPPPNWTTRQLNIKEVKQRSVSPQRYVKVDGDLLPPKIQDLKEDMNCNIHMDLRDARKTTNCRKTSPDRMQPIELNSKEKRQAHSLHELVQEEKSETVHKFEVINVENQKFEEGYPNSSRQNSCRTSHLSPDPKHLFLRIAKCSTNNDKDQKPSTYSSNSETREKSPMSKKKLDKDMKMRIQINSEMPLDLVDGRLKQFLNGVGGLIHFSPKDGGVPRIKELANYFSGKQPLLWFFPRST